MSNPQQPELARSRKQPHQDQDAVAAVIEGQRGTDTDAPRGPVPPENQPGHHPEKEQDKPDLNAFAERLGVAEPTGADPATSDGAPSPSPSPSVFERAPVKKVPIGAVWSGGVVAVAVLVLRRRSRRRGRS